MRAAICFLLAVWSSVLPAAAQFQSPKAPPSLPPAVGDQGRPPFRITGFTYRLMPPQIHMNECSQPSCGLGSKVSYLFYAPKRGMTLNDYKALRVPIDKELRSRLPAGLSMKVVPPTQRKDKQFTTFETRRIITAPDGNTQITISRTLLTPTVSIDLISSGSNQKQVEMNLAVFTVGATLLAVSNNRAKP